MSEIRNGFAKTRLTLSEFKQAFATKFTTTAPIITHESEESRIKAALRTMGHYFELDEKSVKFYIRQLELAGKL